MLLFSTVLKIDESLTKEKFIELVIEWNQNSPYPENIIEDIEWNGEKNVRFGKDNLWLDITEYSDKNIIAVRYEKIENDGVVWDTDYIMNFDDMKMSIQLDRSYKEEALIMDSKFSTPHFITMLIYNKYIKNDGELPVLRDPILVDEKNIEILKDIINGNAKYNLPIVYVSKTTCNNDPVDVKWLASRLKGVAHVLVESDKQLSKKVRLLCDGKNEYNGGIGIYYPNIAKTHRRFVFNNTISRDGSSLLNKVVKTVIEYGISQSVDSLYTWHGVSSSLLNDKLSLQIEQRVAAEDARQKAEDEVDKLYDVFDKDLRDLKNRVNELSRNNEALRCENQGLRKKVNDLEKIPVIYFGDEDDFYQGEIKDIILSELEQALKNIKDKTRRADILTDIIENNNYQRTSEKRQQIIKRLLRNYKNMSGPMKQELLDVGINIIDDGKHYKLVYNDDERYWITIAKTPGDTYRGGKNAVSEIVKTMF